MTGAVPRLDQQLAAVRTCPLSGQRFHDVADVLDRARAAVAAAQAARDRSEEIRLHELLRRGRGRSVSVDPDAEAALRAWLCGAGD